MKPWRIYLLGLASGEAHPLCPGYVKCYDPTYVNQDGYDGGILEITADPNEALSFSTAQEAFSKYRESAPRPYDMRPDGQTNRPLTAFHATVERVANGKRA